MSGDLATLKIEINTESIKVGMEMLDKLSKKADEVEKRVTGIAKQGATERANLKMEEYRAQVRHGNNIASLMIGASAAQKSISKATAENERLTLQWIAADKKLSMVEQWRDKQQYDAKGKAADAQRLQEVFTYQQRGAAAYKQSLMQQSRDMEMYVGKHNAYLLKIAAAQKLQLIQESRDMEMYDKRHAESVAKRVAQEKLGMDIIAMQRRNIAQEGIHKVSDRTLFGGTPTSLVQQTDVYAAVGVKSPQQRIDGINAVKAAMVELNAEHARGAVIGKIYSTTMHDLTGKLNLLESGDVRARNSFRKTASALASVTFEMTGAIYGITALGLALASPAIFGVAMLKRIEDAQTGIAGILLSMGSLNGKALTFGQAWQVSGTLVKQIQQDSLKYGIEMGRLVEVNQAAISGGLTAMLTLEQIQKVATAGAIAVSSLGLNSQQYVQEVRDLISGGIQPASSTLARSIGVTDALLKAWKAEGPEKLVKELTDRLQGFLVVADEVRSSTLTGSWDILQARLAMLLSDEQGFGALKKAVIDVADYIGTVDEKTKKFGFNPELVSTVQGYWNAIKLVGSALVVVGKTLAFILPIAWELAKVMVIVWSVNKYMAFLVFLSSVAAKAGVATAAFSATAGVLTLKTRALILASAAAGKLKVALVSLTLGNPFLALATGALLAAEYFGLFGDSAAEAAAKATKAAEESEAAAIKLSETTGRVAAKSLTELRLLYDDDFAKKSNRDAEIKKLNEHVWATQKAQAAIYYSAMARYETQLMYIKILGSKLPEQMKGKELVYLAEMNDALLQITGTADVLAKGMAKINADSAKGAKGEAKISEAQKLIDKLKERLAVSELDIAQTEKLTTSEKEYTAWKEKLKNQTIQITPAIEKATRALFEQNIANEKGIIAQAGLTKQLDEAAKTRDTHLNGLAKENDEIQKSIDATKIYISEVGQTKEAVALLAATRLDSLIIESEAKLSSMDISDGLAREVLLIQEKIYKLKELRGLTEKKADGEGRQAIIDADAKMWKSIADTMENTMKTAWDNIFTKGQNIWVSLRDSFKKIFMDYVWATMAKPITMNVIAGVAKGVGLMGISTAATAAAGGATSVGSGVGGGIATALSGIGPAGWAAIAAVAVISFSKNQSSKNRAQAAEAEAALFRNLTSVNEVFSKLNLTLFDVSRGGAMAATSLVAALGGLDKFIVKMDSYYNNFTTSEQKRLDLIAKVNKATAGTGFDAATATRPDFSKLFTTLKDNAESALTAQAAGMVNVEGVAGGEYFGDDLVTVNAILDFQAGLDATALSATAAFAAIAGVEDKFDQIAPDFDKVVETLEQAYARLSDTFKTAEQQAQTRISLEQEWLQLTGTTEQLRDAAIAGMDEYNIGLYDQIQNFNAAAIYFIKNIRDINPAGTSILLDMLVRK